MVVEALAASEAKVMVRWFPEPLQTPSAEAQETNEVSGGSVSVTVTSVALPGPLFVTVRV